MNPELQAAGHKQWSSIGSSFVVNHRCKCGSRVIGVYGTAGFCGLSDYELHCWGESLIAPCWFKHSFAFGCPSCKTADCGVIIHFAFLDQAIEMDRKWREKK